MFVPILTKRGLKEWHKRRARIPELGECHTICNWVDPDDGSGAPMIDMHRYADLLSIVPQKVANSLEHARLERAGKEAMFKAGLGYVECLTSIIVDASLIGSSSAESRLVLAVRLPANYLQPGGIPGRTLRAQLRGRATTLTTAATMTFRLRGESTDVITGTAWAASGAITADTVAQTATMWEIECGVTVRAVGSAGQVFAMGDADTAFAAVTIANQIARYMGSAGSATPAGVTKDTTQDTYLNWTAQWSLATAYSMQTHRYMLEALN